MSIKSLPIQKKKNFAFALICGGILFVLIQTKISLMSHSFIFGVGHVERPIIEFLVWSLMGFSVYAFCCCKLIKSEQHRYSKGIIIAGIISVAVLARLVYLPSQIIQETDPYRYVWDGEMIRSGENPYAASPEEAVKNIFPGIDSDAAQTIRHINRRINHPSFKTIYPPGAQFIFFLSQSLTPWGLAGWRILVGFGDIFVICLLMLILKRLRYPLERIIVYAWSPLILKEFWNSLHLDVFMVLFLCVMIYAVSRGFAKVAVSALAFAVLIKWAALVLAPLLWIVIDGNLRKKITYALLFFGIILIAFIPFLGVPPKNLFESLFLFATHWKVNAGLYQIFYEFFVRISVISVITDANMMARWAVGGIFVAIWGASTYWLYSRRNMTSFLKACLVVLASLFFLAPTGNPWYYSWVIPFLVFFPMRSLILFSGLVFLYYLDFYFMYQGRRELFRWVQLIEYSIFYIILGTELWQMKKSRLFLPSTMKIKSFVNP